MPWRFIWSTTALAPSSPSAASCAVLRGEPLELLTQLNRLLHGRFLQPLLFLQRVPIVDRVARLERHQYEKRHDDNKDRQPPSPRLRNDGTASGHHHGVFPVAAGAVFSGRCRGHRLPRRIDRDPVVGQQIAQFVVVVTHRGRRERANQRLVDAAELDALIDELLPPVDGRLHRPVVLYEEDVGDDERPGQRGQPDRHPIKQSVSLHRAAPFLAPPPPAVAPSIAQAFIEQALEGGVACRSQPRFRTIRTQQGPGVNPRHRNPLPL